MTDLFETKSKTVPITKQMVKDAYRKVKSNKGSAGIDQQSLEKYEKKLLDNLYVLWNILSSGSYFPKPVREVEIPKSDGSNRKLGIPRVKDRIAQEVIKTYLEPKFEAIFNQNSYGYRPLRGTHDAIKQVQQNNKSYAWVIDMDIKVFFDEVNHELLMKCLDRHVEEHWVKMYIKRWHPDHQAGCWYATRRCYKPIIGQSFSALCARPMAHENPSERIICTICR
jgi:RNA-directed DNA polymerase